MDFSKFINPLEFEEVLEYYRCVLNINYLKQATPIYNITTKCFMLYTYSIYFIIPIAYSHTLVLGQCNFIIIQNIDDITCSVGTCINNIYLKYRPSPNLYIYTTGDGRIYLIAIVRRCFMLLLIDTLK